jgi:COMPASS component SWD2
MCTALLQAPGLPTVAWDEQGLVFCVGSESGVVKLYDARNYSAGPFVTFVVEQERNSNAVFASLRFSLDGECLLAVVEGRIYALDAFTGDLKQQVSTGIPEGVTALEACLTADGQYILSGCGDRHIRAWSVKSGEEVAKWKQLPATPTCLKFSPKKMVVASASAELALWIPDAQES